MLLAFAVRALIPAGFMPAGDGFFSLELCPGSFPAQALASGGDHSQHHHEAGDPATGGGEGTGGEGFEHCPFGSAPAAGPLAHTASLAVPDAPEIGAFTLSEGIAGERLIRSQQARGPPVLS